MKKIRSSFLWLFVLVGINLVLVLLWASGVRWQGKRGSGPEFPQGHDHVSVEGVGFASPAAVVHDVASDLYLVSNVDGGGLERDGNGFISRIRPTGRGIDLRWIEGGESGVVLNAPKGMTLRGDTLYVADIDCVRRFHRFTGQPLGETCLPGATNLKALAFERRGPLYITDQGLPGGSDAGESGALYSIDDDGEVREVLRGDTLGGPTGIATSFRGVFVAGFDNGSVSQLWPEGLKPFVRGRHWQLEGLIIIPDGSFLFSSWSDSTVLFIQAKDGGSRGDISTLVRRVPTPGHLGHDAERSRLLIPVLEQNRVFFLDLWPS
jgi:hypothetical protein